ncbi:MAG TPA: DEAD/DEAH box helicase, partial [Stenomitos sp.]
MRFDDFDLPSGILDGVRSMGFTSPTPVQAAAIPEVLKGKDLLVQAKTGSGKTLAFGLPILARLDPASPDTQVLIIVPTRELAIQVAQEINKIGGHLGVLVSAIYGGIKMDTQMTDLAWASVIVGTPGRLRDHISRGNLNLNHCKTVVLDEADEMLDMGFKDDLEFLLEAVPQPRTTLLFSATFPKAIENIGRKYMRNAEKIAVSSGLTTPVDITHRFVRVSESNRVDALISILQKDQPDLAFVFCKRKSETSSVARKLKAAGIRAGFLNGDMNQAQRNATMDQFRRHEINILVATDVAARGLDISGISHVFNLTVPMDTETYVHRSGRTGRAGKKGICITLVTPEEQRSFAKIQQDLAESARKQAAEAPRQAPAPAPERRPEPSRPARQPEERRTERPAPQAERRPEPARQTSEGRERHRRSEAPVERPSRPRVSAEAILQAANGQAEAYRAIAQELLRQADAERLVAALLSQSSTGRRLMEQQGSSEGNAKDESHERRSRSRYGNRRLMRKPS